MDDPDDITAEHFRNLLNAFGLAQHVRSATHVYGHTLDLIITQPSFSPTLVITDPTIISDHELILCDFTVVRSTPAPLRQVVSRRLKAINTELFAHSITQLPICADLLLLTNCSVTNLCELFNTQLRDLLDGVAPPVLVSVTERFSSPWFDAECRAPRRHTRACERRYRHTSSPADLLSWRTALEDKKALFTVKEKTY